MSPFYMINEDTEDTLDSATNLQDAIRIAREVAQEGQAGDPVSIELDGKIARQFMLMPDGKVAEEAIA
jgi:hypothetical protein